jgi:DNA topoisomerase-3
MPRFPVLSSPHYVSVAIPKEQAQKLLATGKTDLLEGFISKRGRPFSAYLKSEDGKVSFEFPEKIARTGGT